MMPRFAWIVACGVISITSLTTRLASAQDTAGTVVVLHSKTTSAAPPTAVIGGAATRVELQGTKDDNAATFQTSLALARVVVVLGLSAKPDGSKPNTALTNTTGLGTGTTASLGLTGVTWLGARQPSVSPGDCLLYTSPSPRDS